MSVSRDPLLEPTDGDEIEPGAPASTLAPMEFKESKELSDYKAVLEEVVTCDLSTCIYYDPVRLPGSNQVVERDYAKKLKKDPYTKKPFVYSDDMPTDTRIKKAVDAYLALNKSAEEKQYGYEERRLLKEAEARRAAQALLDDAIHDQAFAYGLLEDEKQAPQQDAARLPAAVDNNEQPIEGDPLERARIPMGDVITYLDNFSRELDAEIKDLPHFSQYSVLWVTNYIFFLGTMTTLILWFVSRAQTDALVERMANTPSTNGSSTFCDSWLDATDIVLPCFHFNAIGDLITEVCQRQCDSVSDVVAKTIYERIFLIISSAGLLITALGLLSSVSSVRPNYGCTIRALHFKNPERRPLHDFSFALREQGYQLFRHVNVFREGDERRLSGDVSVGEIKTMLRQLRGRIALGNAFELAPVPEVEMEGRAVNVGDPENPVSPQILFQMIKVFLDQLDHHSLTQRSRLILTTGVSAAAALIWAACNLSFNGSIVELFSQTLLKDGATCHPWLGFINTADPCKQPQDQPVIPQVCEALCHALSRNNVEMYIDGPMLLLSGACSLVFLIATLFLDRDQLLDWNRVFNKKLPASLYDTADTLFRQVNFQPGVLLTRESRVNDTRKTLTALQARLMGGV